MSKQRLVSIPSFGAYDPGTIQRAEIREKFGEHGLAILDFPVTRSRLRAMVPDGTPMAYQWGYTPTTVRNFYGYVNHHEILDDIGTHPAILRLFCLGTSLVMNDQRPSSWQKVSASYVARQIAERHGLRCILSRSNRVLDYWAQGNESDFSMMNRLAAMVGFRFWVDGSTLYFLDPRILLKQSLSGDTPTFTMDRGVQPDTLLDIEVISGSAAPGGAAIQEVYGVDRNTGAALKSVSSTPSDSALPLRRTTYPWLVGSLQEARQINEASTAQNQWATLQAVVVGNPSVRVGQTVSLSGAALPAQHEGDWLVGGAISVMDTPDSGEFAYTVQADLMRNQKNSLSLRPTILRGAVRDVPATFRTSAKKWESKMLETVYV